MPDAPHPPDAQAVVVEDIRQDLLELNNAASRALSEGRIADAIEALSRAAASLTCDEDGLAPVVYENLGLALMRAQSWRAAARALLRALDGDVSGVRTGRALAARLLVVALHHDGKAQWASQALAAYRAQHGDHPDFPNA
jgi:hypothetical protein